jgi:aspartyl protease family protein
MRQLFVLAAILIGVSVLTARYADHFAYSLPSSMVTNVFSNLSRPAVTSGYPRTVEIQRDRSGHYTVEGFVDGQRLRFMVDTGASVIALTMGDAARLGIYPSERDFTAKVGTANGPIHAAPVRLREVEIDGIVVRDVQAMVLPERALGGNLLGLSFLSRLRRYEFSGGKLVLEQ